MSCLPEPTMHSGDTGQQIPFFDSCQLITTWVSNTKFYTDSIKVCHFPSTNMKGWTYIRTYSVQTIFSEPKFLGSIVTIFSYLWCSTARAPLKYMRNVNMMYKTVYCNSTSIYHCLNCYSKLYSSTIDEPGEVPCTCKIDFCTSLCFSLGFSSAFFRMQIFMWLMGFRNQHWSAVFPATTGGGPYMYALSRALCDL